MAEFLILMRNDASRPPDNGAWPAFLDDLAARGHLRGGSAIGPAHMLRQSAEPAAPTEGSAGYIKVEADDLTQVQALMACNPVYLAGGTLEVRDLPVTG